MRTRACCLAALAALTLAPRPQDVIVRYGDDRDLHGVVLEFLMRQDEVASALVGGASVTRAQYRARHPELFDDDEL